MTKYNKGIQYILLTTLLIACGGESNDDSPILKDELTLNLTAKVTVEVDEVVPITITANKAIAGVSYSLDNFVTDVSQFTSFGNSTTVYLNTSTLGNKQVSIKITDEENNSVSETITIKVEKGNALQLKGLLVNSFHNMNQTWDPEFSESDVNRLADVFFVFLKPQIGVFSGEKSQQLWFKSSIKQNQGDLNWDLLGEDLYVNPSTVLKFSLADEDGTFAQDLMLGPPYEKDINLSSYASEKPSIINLKDAAIDLNVDFEVGW